MASLKPMRPEVVPRARRRQFTADYKKRILGLAVKRRGPKPKYDPLAEEVRKRKLHKSQLMQRLARAELIIDVQ